MIVGIYKYLFIYSHSRIINYKLFELKVRRLFLLEIYFGRIK